MDEPIPLRARLMGVFARPKEAKELVDELGLMDELNLEREPTNEYDPNAIKVIHPSGTHIGYIQRDLAEVIAPFLDEGYEYRVEVISLMERRKPTLKLTPLTQDEAA